MPSANNKTEKAPATDAVDPLKQAIVIVEHKIRNLEKRKAKLDSYRESGKPLSRDVQEAVNKYDEVVQQLELSREYVKQFTTICNDSDKAKKKALKKEALERTASETNKIKQVLLIQDVLQNMGTDKARDDFLTGQNGAISLSDNDLKFLDDLYAEVSPKHEGSVAFQTQVQKAAEHLMAIVDGKNRELAGTTCAKLWSLILSIHECGYFDHQTADSVVEEVTELTTDPIEPIQDEVVLPHSVPQEAPLDPVQPVPHSAELPLTIPNAAPIHSLLQNIVPVSQVESNLFNAQGFKPPSANPQPTPLNDVISRVSGKFTFFQESELEISEMGPPQQAGQQAQTAVPPSAIPTRTFTNQTFNNQTAPAPMSYPRAPYFVGSFPQAPPHYSPELIQGFAGTQPVPNVNAANTNSIPLQNQRPTGDSPNRAYQPQPPPHLASGYASQPNPVAVGPTVPTQQPYQHPSTNIPHQPPTTEEPSIPSVKEIKPDEESSQQNWPTERLEWANDEWSEWNAQTNNGSGVTESKDKDENAENSDRLEWSDWNPAGNEGGKNSGGSRSRGDRNDRPRNNNYQGNRPGNRNNYSNNRSGNRENFYNNHNGYQARNDYSRDSRDQNSFKDRDMNGTRDRDGGYTRGPRHGTARPRVDRGDRPPASGGAPRNNPGVRQPRGGQRGSQHNNYRQEQQTTAK